LLHRRIRGAAVAGFAARIVGGLRG